MKTGAEMVLGEVDTRQHTVDGRNHETGAVLVRAPGKENRKSLSEKRIELSKSG
jgi:hypothetical protein